MAEKQIDAKYLSGLKFTGSTVKEVKEDGRVKKKWTPFERDLTVADVLNWADKGDSIVIVAADGQKHIVAKKGK